VTAFVQSGVCIQQGCNFVPEHKREQQAVVVSGLSELGDELVIHLLRFAAQGCVPVQNPGYQARTAIQPKVLHGVVIGESARLPAVYG